MKPIKYLTKQFISPGFSRTEMQSIFRISQQEGILISKRLLAYSKLISFSSLNCLFQDSGYSFHSNLSIGHVLYLMGIPSGLLVPSDLGMQARSTGLGLYCFTFIFLTKPSRFSVRLASYSSTVILSIPGDLPLFSSQKHSIRKSSVSRCTNDVNLHFGFFLTRRVRKASFVDFLCPPLSAEEVSLTPRCTTANPFSLQTLLCFIDNMGQSDCQNIFYFSLPFIGLSKYIPRYYCKGLHIW